MANPTCTKAALNLACFSNYNLDLLNRKALMVYFKAVELNAIGGTNYLNGLISGASGGLIGDTTGFLDEKASKDLIGRRQIGLFELATAQATALAASGQSAASIATLMQNVRCLRNVNESMLDSMILFLDCQLGVHKTYPQ